MAKKLSASSRRARLTSVTSEDIKNREWTESERQAVRRIAKSQAAGDDSISGAMNVLARQGKARVFDIQGRLWLDLDDPATLHKAEDLLSLGRL